MLFAAVGTLPANRPTSWIASGTDGLLAVPCYVLKSNGSAMIIDTGLAVHWDSIRNGLDLLLADCPRRALIMTRREPDAICNLPAIVERYTLQAIYCGGRISPLDFFERVETTSAASYIRSIAKSDVAWLQPGAAISIGDLRLDILATTFRVLPKNHLYEHRSRSLFASDTWGLLPQSEPDGLGIVRSADSRLSLAGIVDHLRHRFEWLAGIDTSPMQRELADFFSSHPVDRICSSYGCVIEGRALVASFIQTTIEALDILARAPHADRLASLNRDLLAAALA